MPRRCARRRHGRAGDRGRRHTRASGQRWRATRLSTAGLTGITLYEPGALTLVARAGTPLAEVEAALAAEGQMLPFEPWDGRGADRRERRADGRRDGRGQCLGAAADRRPAPAATCMIGVRFVDGTGAVVKNGGRVMKNVTGLDLVKLMAGSHGTLGVLTEVGFKVLPRPEATATLVIEGLDAATAGRAMTRGDGDAVRRDRRGARAGGGADAAAARGVRRRRWRTGRGRSAARWPGSGRRRSRQVRATGRRSGTPRRSPGGRARSGGSR